MGSAAREFANADLAGLEIDVRDKLTHALTKDVLQIPIAGLVNAFVDLVGRVPTATPALTLALTFDASMVRVRREIVYATKGGQEKIALKKLMILAPM